MIYGMKKCMIRNYVVTDSKVKWSNGKFAVVQTWNKRVDSNGVLYGHEFCVYEVCWEEFGQIGDCVDCFDDFRSAVKFVEENV